MDKPELLPPEQGSLQSSRWFASEWFPAGKRIWQTQGGRVAASSLLSVAGILWLLSQFFTLRGYVSLIASRLCLAGICILLCLPLWVVAFNLRRWRKTAAIISAVAVIAVVVAIDQLTLKRPSTVSPDATIASKSNVSAPNLVLIPQSEVVMDYSQDADGHRVTNPAVFILLSVESNGEPHRIRGWGLKAISANGKEVIGEPFLPAAPIKMKVPGAGDYMFTDNQSLFTLAARNAIQPGDAVPGWVFFLYPPGLDRILRDGTTKMVLSVQDSQGKSWDISFDAPQEGVDNKREFLHVPLGMRNERQK